MEISKKLLVAHVALQSLGGNPGVLRRSSALSTWIWKASLLMLVCSTAISSYCHPFTHSSERAQSPGLPLPVAGRGPCGRSATRLLMNLVDVHIMASLLGWVGFKTNQPRSSNVARCDLCQKGSEIKHSEVREGWNENNLCKFNLASFWHVWLCGKPAWKGLQGSIWGLQSISFPPRQDQLFLDHSWQTFL